MCLHIIRLSTWSLWLGVLVINNLDFGGPQNNDQFTAPIHYNYSTHQLHENMNQMHCVFHSLNNPYKIKVGKSQNVCIVLHSATTARLCLLDAKITVCGMPDKLFMGYNPV